MDDRKPDGTTDNPPPHDKERSEEGRKNREEMDQVPPHGTDPLHEGP